MALHNVIEGLDISLPGAPEQAVREEKHPRRVAVLLEDYPYARPVLRVAMGDFVKRGQLLFEEGATGVRYTSPGAGRVEGLHRDASGRLESVTVALNERERDGTPAAEDFQAFEPFTGRDLALCTGAYVKSVLLESGLWTALRTRPFGHVADPRIEGFALFINAMDTEPLAPNMDAVAGDRNEDFAIGALAVSKLVNGYVFYCRSHQTKTVPPPNVGIMIHGFPGTHPFGTAGLHMHQLEPARRDRPIWHIGLQDVLAIGALFRTGRLDVTRVIALSGPGVARPRLIRTRLGASLEDITEGELHPGPRRVLSGSVLSGREVSGAGRTYLGRYHQQVCVVPEPPERRTAFLRGWMSLLLPLRRGKSWEWSSGSDPDGPAMYPAAHYEWVFPFDLPVMHLLSALRRRDYAHVEALGGLELEEEDLALCSYLSPEHIDYGRLLREALTALKGEEAP